MEEYDSLYYSTTAVDNSADAGFFVAMLGLYLIIAVILYIVQAIFLGMIFKKAGVASWKAWVPVYNTWLMFELGKQSGWLSLLLFIPFINIIGLVFMYIAMYHIGLKLQKEGWFVLLAVFLPFVWMIWLGVDKSTWEGKSPAEQQPPTVPPSAPQPVA